MCLLQPRPWWWSRVISVLFQSFTNLIPVSQLLQIFQKSIGCFYPQIFLWQPIVLLEHPSLLLSKGCTGANLILPSINIWENTQCTMQLSPCKGDHSEIWDNFSPQPPFSSSPIISYRNIWRLPAAQFRFCIIFGVEHSLLQQTILKENQLQFKQFAGRMWIKLWGRVQH